MQTVNWDLQALKATDARWIPPGPDGDGVTSKPSRPAVIEAPILVLQENFRLWRPVWTARRASMIRAATQEDHLGEFENLLVLRG